MEHAAAGEVDAAGGSQRGVLLRCQRAGAGNQRGAVVVGVLAVRRGEFVPARAIELMVRIRNQKRLHLQRLLQRTADSPRTEADGRHRWIQWTTRPSGLKIASRHDVAIWQLRRQSGRRTLTTHAQSGRRCGRRLHLRAAQCRQFGIRPS